MGDCPRCGKNHYDQSRPTVPTCPFRPEHPSEVPDITKRCELAASDERYSTGALYREAAAEIESLRARLDRAERALRKYQEADECEDSQRCADLLNEANELMRAALPEEG